MKSKSIFLMAVSLGFGLVAAIGITQVMGRSNQPAPTREEPKLPIMIAVQDIDINDELTEEMFTEEEWPARLVPEGVATSFEDLNGMVTTARIGRKGTVLLSNLIEKTKLREKKIPVGFKVIGIKLGADDHLNGLLEAGDLVDIMAVFRGKNRNDGAGSTTRTFLRKITVWSIGSKTKKDIEQNSNAKGSTVVGLLVTEKQAERIVLAERIAELKLAMRGKEDADPETMSGGTGREDLIDTGVAVADQTLNRIMQQWRGNQAGQPGIPGLPFPPGQTPMFNGQPGMGTGATMAVTPAREQFTMIVHTASGPTQYHFDKETGYVPSKVEGFAGETQPQAETEEPAADFSEDEADVDSASLIDELDSEPGS
jgi:Flp pilus assembly protein CpaB